MNTPHNRLSIESTLELILAYAKRAAKGISQLPLVIRTDSSVTSDILRSASERLLNLSENGIKVIYNYVTSISINSIELLRGTSYIMIVDWDFELEDWMSNRIEFIDCFNEKALTVTTLCAELKNLPKDLYIFARVDYSSGLYPICVNNVLAGTVSYDDTIMKLRSVSQMLDELEPICDSVRAVIYHNAFFVGIDEYELESDYAIIEVVSKNKFVDELVVSFS